MLQNAQRISCGNWFDVGLLLETDLDSNTFLLPYGRGLSSTWRTKAVEGGNVLEGLAHQLQRGEGRDCKFKHCGLRLVPHLWDILGWPWAVRLRLVSFACAMI